MRKLSALFMLLVPVVAWGQIDYMNNFAKVTTSGGYTSGSTVITLYTGNGARLPDPSLTGSFQLVWWNATNYAEAADDPYREIVRCTNRVEDIITVLRGQEGTTAQSHNLPGRVYRMQRFITAQMWNSMRDTAGTGSGGVTGTGLMNAVAVWDGPSTLGYKGGALMMSETGDTLQLNAITGDPTLRMSVSNYNMRIYLNSSTGAMQFQQGAGPIYALADLIGGGGTGFEGMKWGIAGSVQTQDSMWVKLGNGIVVERLGTDTLYIRIDSSYTASRYWVAQNHLNKIASAAGKFLISNADPYLYVERSISGDVTVDDLGVSAIGAGKVSPSMLATQAGYTVLANNTAGSASPSAVTFTALKTAMSLSNVENKALSTWTGDGQTITSMTWHGTLLDTLYGGTGATNRIASLRNLLPGGGSVGEVLEIKTTGPYTYGWGSKSAGAGDITSVAITVPSSLFSPSSYSQASGDVNFNMTLGNQTANYFFAGPVGGGSATPTWRILNSADLSAASMSISSLWSFSQRLNLQASAYVGVQQVTTGDFYFYHVSNTFRTALTTAAQTANRVLYLPEIASDDTLVSISRMNKAITDSTILIDTLGLRSLFAQGKSVKAYPALIGDSLFFKVGEDSTGSSSGSASDTLQYYWTFADSQGTIPADKFPLGHWPYAIAIDSIRFMQFSGSSPNMTPTFSYGKYIDSVGISFGTFSAVTASTTVYRPQAVIVLANMDAWLQWGTFSSEPKRWAVSVMGHRAVENRPWFDATSKSETGVSGTSLVWSHTVGTQANRYLVVSACLSSSSITSVYWKTTPMVVVAAGNNYCYELVNPESGTGDITINFAASTTAAAVGCSYWNVDPATSSGSIDVGQPAPTSQTWWYIDAPSTTVNQIVISSVHDGGYGTTSTPDAPGQIQRNRAAIGSGEVVFFNDVPANTGTTRSSGFISVAHNWYARAWRVSAP